MKPETGYKFVGLSLSACIKQIIENKINVDGVDSIVAGTACRNIADLETAIDGYSKTYWKEFPNNAAALAWYFWNEGKIVQPRLESGYVHSVADGFWVEIPHIDFSPLYNKVSDMSDSDLESVWESLTDYSHAELYGSSCPHATMDDWAQIVYSEISARRYDWRK